MQTEIAIVWQKPAATTNRRMSVQKDEALRLEKVTWTGLRQLGRRIVMIQKQNKHV